LIHDVSIQNEMIESTWRKRDCLGKCRWIWKEN